MRNAYLWLGALGLLASAACSSEPARTNPFDPQAPATVQAKAKVVGTVQLEANTEKAGVKLVARQAVGTAPVSYDTESLADGTFAIELPPGLYNLHAAMTGYRNAAVGNLQLGPGEQRDVGLLTLGVARGALGGSVVLDDGASPSGVSITLLPQEMPGAEPVTVLASPDGSYYAPELASGRYLLRAEKSTYAPSYTAEPLVVTENERQTAPMMRLYPAAAVVKVQRDQQFVRYTNARQVSVVLLPFVTFLEQMRLSEDPTFADAAWDTDWRQFNTPVDFTVADVEGERTVWAQFKDTMGIESEPFSGSVIYDRTAPQVMSLTLNGGAAFLTALDGAGRATLAFTGFDALSGIDAWRYTLAESFGDEPFRPIESVGTTLSDVQTVELGDADGQKTVRVQLRDRAGNLVEAEPVSIFRDKTPPALGSPALALDPAVVDATGAARSLDVRLVFDVHGDREGEKLFVALANAPGLDANALFSPLASPFSHRLAEGADGAARQVCAIFRDEAGLLTEQQCITVRVDRSARLRGLVRLEGGASSAGVVVTPSRLDEATGAYVPAGANAVVGADGAYSIAGLAPGTWQLAFARAGYETKTVPGLAAGEGADQRLPDVELAIARGGLTGRVALQGETSHDGIRVEAAPGVTTLTDVLGNYSFSGLPARSYTLRAERRAFQPGTVEVEVLAGQTVTAEDVVLAPLPTGLHGIARLRGRTVHSGIDVLAVGVTVAGSEQRASTVTDDAGAFALTGLTAGSWRVTLSATGFRSVRDEIGEVLLTPEAAKDLGEWTLEPAAGSVAGTVTLSDRTNHEGVRVALLMAGVERQTTFTDRNGSYLFSGVPVGIYSLSASLGGYTRGTQPSVTVLAEQTTTVGALTLTPQVGNVWLEDGAGGEIAAATRLTTVQVRGIYPDAAAVRVCENPAVQPSLGGDPANFTLTDCGWTALAPVTAGQPFAPVAKSFAASECPNPGDAVRACDGAKTLYVRVRDTAGIESQWFEVPVVLDRQPPAGVIAISPTASTVGSGGLTDGGAPYTRSLVVGAAIDATEDRSGVREGDAVSGVARARLYRTPTDAAPVVVALQEGGTTLEGLTLQSGADGVRSLYLVVEDWAGNVSVESLATVGCPEPRSEELPESCDTIFLDTTPPQTIAFSINPVDLGGSWAVGAAWTTTPVVQLGIDSTLTGLHEDQAVEATLSNDSGFAASVVQALAGPRTVVSWALAPGDGSRRVYLKVRDHAGNLSAAISDEIGVDTTAPESPVLFAVGAYTRDSTPALAFAAVSGATGYRLQLSDDSFRGGGLVEVTQALSGTSFVPAAPLADGVYQWRVKALDAAGLESAYSFADSFTVDTVAPAAPVLAAVASPTRLNRPNLTWGGVGDAASYLVELDTVASFASGPGGAPLQSVTTPGAALTTEVLADGTWHWRVKAQDRAGNVSAPSAAGSFVVDTLAPANPVLSAPADDALLARPAVNFSFGAVTGAAAYLVDYSSGVDFAAYERTETTGTSRALTLADGTWFWRVLSRDAAGNLSDASAAQARRLTIDTAAPATPELVAVPSPSNDSTPRLSWSAVADAASYVVTLDGIQTVVTATFLDPAALADGVHGWTVAAQDAAGNRSPDAAAQSFVIDTTPPAVPAPIAFTPDPTNSASPTVAWAAVAEAGSYDLQWDKVPSFNGTDLRNATTTSTSHTLPLASDGTWFWRVRSADAVGSASAWSAADSFVRDTAAPANPAPSAPANDALVASRTVSLSWSAVADAAAYLVDYSQDATLATFDRVETTLTARGLTVSADGDWYWRVLSRDAAGNLSAVATAAIRHLQVDTVAPAAPVLVAVASPTADSTPALSWSAVTGAASYVLTLDGAPIAVTGTSHTPGAALSDASHTWTVAALDAAGNRSPDAPAQSFVVDTTPPAVPSAVAFTPDPTNAATPPVVWAAVAGAATYGVQWDKVATFNGTDAGTAIVNSASHALPLASDGTWYWRVRSIDSVGNASAWSMTDSFVRDTAAPANPTLSAPADDALVASRTVSLSWSAVGDAAAYLVDYSQDATLATYDRLESTLTSRGVAVSSDGDWYWRVLARDAAGNLSPVAAAAVRHLQVDTVAPAAPVLTAVASPTADSTPALSWSAVTGASSYVLTLDGAATTVTGTSHAPGVALPDGSHTWTVAAQDAAGNRSPDAPAQSFVVDTTPPAVPAPVAFTPDPTNASSPAVAWAAVVGASTYEVQWDKVATFNGTDAGTATVNSASHALPLASDGTWHWRVRSIDSVGNASAWSTTDSFVRDTAAPANPALSSPANDALVASRTVSLSWSAVGDAAAYLVDYSQSATLATWDRIETTLTARGVAVSADGDWYWRVLARDSAGNLSPVATAAVRHLQVDTVAPETPVLAAVTSPTADSTPTLSWSAVTGAASYLLTLDGVATTAAGTSHTPGAALSDGSHTWTVAAQDAAGNRSVDAPAQSFVVDTAAAPVPVPVAYAPDPTNSASPAVAWAAVAGAASYGVQWDKVATFNGADLGSATGTSTSHPLPLGSDGTWYWRVRSIDPVGNVSAWSTTDSFVRDTAAPANPALSSPANDALVASRTVTLSWSAVGDAAAYLVDYSQSATLATYDRVETTMVSRGLTVSADGDWYWRVLSRDAAGNLSPVATAAIRHLQVDTAAPAAPALVAVVSPTNDNTPTLSWSAVTGAASYVLTLDGAPTTVTGTSHTPGAALSDASHTWTVAALDSAGNRSVDAPAQSFVVDTTPPAVPALIAYSPDPTNAASPVVGWATVAGAAGYGVQFDKVASFNSTDLGSSTGSATSAALPLGSDGTWYWRVRSLDAVNNASAWSAADSFVRDTAAPVNPALSSPANNALMASRGVTVAWNAVADAAVYLVDYSQSTTLASYERVETAGTSQALALPVDGDWYWRVLSRDAAGNLSAVATATIRKVTIDTAPPAAPALATVASPTNDSTPTLSWSAVTGATAYVVSVDGVETAVTGTSHTPAVALAEGSHTWTVAARDAAGNRGDSAALQTFVVDTAAPAAPTFVIAQAPYSNSRRVTLQVTTSGAATMMLSNRSDFAGAAWESFTASRDWDLDGGDGARSVYLKLQDAAGNATAPVQASTTLDTTAPANLAVSIAGGAAYLTTSDPVTVTLGATDTNGVSQVWLSNDPTFSTGGWEGYTTSRTGWNLAAGEGEKSVYVRFKDAAGNVSEMADTVVRDTGAPELLAASFQEGAATADPAVTLQLVYSGATELQLTGDVTSPVSGSWNPVAASVAVTLASATDGDKSVAVRLRDPAGNLSAAQNLVIRLDASDPGAGAVVLTGPAADGDSSTVTGSPAVSVALSGFAEAGSGLVSMMVSEDAAFAGAIWEDYRDSFPFVLSGGDGAKTLYVKTRDAVGNESAAASGSILLDTAAPSLAATLIGAAANGTSSALTRLAAVSVQLAASDAQVAPTSLKYQLSNTADFQGASWTAWGGAGSTWTLPASWTLASPGADGSKVVYVRVRDTAGNVYATTAAIVLDTEPPAGLITAADGAAYTQLASVGLAMIAGGDLSGVAEMALANEDVALDCSTAAYGAFSTKQTWPLVDAEGTHRVSMCLKDAAGNFTASPVWDEIFLDKTNPDAVIAVAAGADYTTSLDVSVSITPAADDTAQMKVSNSILTCGSNSDWSSFAPTVAHRLSCSSGDTCTVYVCLRDAAGRVSALLTDAIGFDNVAPSVTSFAIAGGEWTNTADGLLAIDVSGATWMKLSGNLASADGQSPDTWIAYKASPAVVFSSGDGAKSVIAQFRDDAWNLSTVYSDTITLDTAAPENGSVEIVQSPYTTGTQVDLRLVSGGATRMCISGSVTSSCSDATATSTWEAFQANKAVTLTTGETLKTVTVRFGDEAGNKSAATVSATTTYDVTAPIPDLTAPILVTGRRLHPSLGEIDDPDASYKTTVALTLKASGATAWALANSTPDCASASYVTQAFVAGAAAVSGWELSSGTGSKTVYVCFADDAGNVTSAPVSDAIYLDQSAPTNLAFSIASGAEFVTLTTTSLGGIASSEDSALGKLMQFSNCPDFAATGCDTTAWLSYSATAAWTLLSGDGTKTVYMKHRDYAGNVSAPVSDLVVLDGTAPAAPTVVINNGATVTDTDTVSLAIAATDANNVSDMYLSRNGLFNDGAWEPFATSKSFDIDGALTTTGSRTVYVKVHDRAGNLSAAGSATIVVDRDAPTLSSVTIAAGAAWTRSTSVRLALVASDVAPGSLKEMMLSEDAAFAGANWIGYLAGPTFTLSSVNGDKVVYAKVRDSAGRESTSKSDGIKLDTQAPTVRAFEFAAGEYVNSTSVSVTLDAVDAVASTTEISYAVSNSALDCAANGTWTAMTAAPQTVSHTLASCNTSRSAYLCLRDAADNRSAREVATVFCDSIAPTAPVLDDALPGSSSVTLNWTASTDSGSGVSHYRVTVTPTGGTAYTVESSSTTVSVGGLTPQLKYSFTVAAIDRAGNASAESNPVSTVPGWQQITLSPKALMSTVPATPRAFRPYYFDGSIFIPAVTPGVSGGAIGFFYCDVHAQDCRETSSWTFSEISKGFIDAPAGFSMTRAHPGLLVLFGSKKSGVVGEADPYVWTCDPFNRDCSQGSEWDEKDFAISFSGWASQSTIASNSNVTAAVWRSSTGLQVSVCAKGSFCATAADWGEPTAAVVTLSSSNVADGSEPAVVVDQQNIWVAYEDEENKLRVSKCDLRQDCKVADGWTSFVLDASTAGRKRNIVLAESGVPGYLTWEERAAGGVGTRKIASCYINCHLVTAWTTATMATHPATPNDAPVSYDISRVGHELRAVWQDPSDATLKYSTCPKAKVSGTGGCITASNWQAEPTILARNMPVGTPRLSAYGTNPIITSHDAFDFIRVIQPRIPTPVGYAAMPGAASLQTAWQPFSFVDGYLQRYDAANPPVANSVSLADPALTSNAVATAGKTLRYSYLRSVLGGEYGINSPTIATRPFGTFTVPNPVVLAGEGNPVFCFNSDGNRLVAAYATNSDPTYQDLYVGHCRVDATTDYGRNCDQAANWKWNWADYVLRANETYVSCSVAVQDDSADTVASASRVAVVGNTSKGNKTFAYCNDMATSGCDAPGDYKRSVLVSAPTTLGMGKVAIFNDTYAVVFNDTGGAKNTHVKLCTDSGTVCSTAANWTARDIDTAFPGYGAQDLGIDIAASKTLAGHDYMLTLAHTFKYTDVTNFEGIRFCRCYLGNPTSAANCAAEDSWFCHTVSNDYNIKEISMTKANTGTSPVLIGYRVSSTDRNEYNVASCRDGCDTQQTWTYTNLMNMSVATSRPGQMSIASTYNGANYRHYAVLENLSTLYLASCDTGMGECNRIEGWSMAPISSDLTQAKPAFNARSITTTFDGQVFMTSGVKNATSGTVKILTGGTSYPVSP